MAGKTSEGEVGCGQLVQPDWKGCASSQVPGKRQQVEPRQPRVQSGQVVGELPSEVRWRFQGTLESEG